ncbi:glycoprotease family-domain-containing protein [Nemania sp. FL0031]|nr:glycoprotease family-domain-containing protein [Nemania sp. FL0031]
MSTPWKLSRQRLPGGTGTIGSLLRRCRRRVPPRNPLTTLAIETSCDDTCVAILEKDVGVNIARMHFNEKITSDNRSFGGVHPLNAVVSHTQHLGPLVQKSLRALPKVAPINAAWIGRRGGDGKVLWVDGIPRRRPDFISVTRGPGMASNLATGLATAKGLAVAWDVPLVAVNHMQAHALTPRLVAALRAGKDKANKPTGKRSGSPMPPSVEFPFYSLLVSGGHTMLVRSQSLTEHTLLADSMNIAIGDMLDKCARLILPPEVIAADESTSGMYGPLLEEFAFPGSKDTPHYDYNYSPPTSRAEEINIFYSEYGWTLTPPLANWGKATNAAITYDFAGLNGQIQKLMLFYKNMGVAERRLLAQQTMRLVFEHLVTRIRWVLEEEAAERRKNPPSTEDEGQGQIKTLVLSGGVASNKYLRHIVREMLDIRGYNDIKIIAPPMAMCTDNAAMIAWTGMEMYEEGWRSDLSVVALRKWLLDHKAESGGILEAEGWVRVPGTKQ